VGVSLVTRTVFGHLIRGDTVLLVFSCTPSTNYSRQRYRRLRIALEIENHVFRRIPVPQTFNVCCSSISSSSSSSSYPGRLLFAIALTRVEMKPEKGEKESG